MIDLGGSMNKINLQDQIVRRAIWEVYKCKSFYTGQPINYTDLQIDHIIPVSYKDKPEELNRLISECGLDTCFELDSLYNVVPTNRYENRLKSDKKYNVQTIMFYLGLAEKNISTIEEKIVYLKKTRNLENHLAMLKSHYDQEDDKKKREQLLNKIIRFIDTSDRNFIIQESIYCEGEERIYRNYSAVIGLEAILPRYNNVETKCILKFKTHRANNIKVVLSNKIILSQLFSGLFTDPKYGCREFILFDNSKQNEDEVFDLKNSSVSLGGVELELSEEDIYTLCDIIDSYARKYIDYINEIENVLKTHSLQLSARRNNYKLIDIDSLSWRKLINFANRHDDDMGKSKWHIFDKNYHMLKIYTNKDHYKYNLGYHAFFNIEHANDIIFYPTLTSPRLYITWELIETPDKKGPQYINEENNWNAEIAHDWLVKSLIPRVLGKKKQNEIYKTEMSEIEKILQSNICDPVYYIKRLNIENKKELHFIVSLLQIHFYSRPHNIYRMSSTSFKRVYNSILICLRKSKKADLHYICNKLHLNDCHTLEELCSSIEEISNSMQDSNIEGFGLDFLFRAFLAVLESGNSNINSNEIKTVVQDLDYFIETHDREVLLDKYTLEFI
ncbi:MAG: hypothetical protein K0S61_303 [Anaerocolumna sp.]|jgi:hypothetical protein|nr:hypothetical protein [Anaerocolumna sp.]